MEEKQFKEGAKYSGEILYGGCGCLDCNYIRVIKREGNSLTYQEFLGKAEGNIVTAPIETIENWGEYVAAGEDRFFAYSIEKD
ncbi:MAG: hypothetical protein NC112_02740 [Oxalobacter formigenes]|nr:hypothetical protein [Oxalobacter formigenes]MCM1281055.1 hypothetical protein [Alistipes senegalensis]MCM1512017.1 hypothetical protein [Oxalobacter formigenes]